jgi:fido (protein-threonine AMPylation protein)
MEMNGHNKVIEIVLKMGKGELSLSEKRVKEIHKAIMYEDDSSKVALVGNWKKDHNEIINYKNEKITFATPDDVPHSVHQTLDEVNSALEKVRKGTNKIHPVVLAAQFHIDFITIHPFYDGNGRTSRILTNIILIACGYPAIIIKDKHKEQYYQLLGDIQAYGGHPSLFFAFIGERVLDTQQLILDAIEGKDIDEEDDLDKKLALLEMELDAVDPNDEVKFRLNIEVFTKIFHGWLGELIKTAIPEIQKFNKFFTGTEHSIYLANIVSSNFINEKSDDLIRNLEVQFIDNKSHFQNHASNAKLQTSYGTLIKGGLKTFGCNYGIEVRFETIKYEVYVDEFDEESKQRKQIKLFERLLHKPLTETEIKSVVKHLTDAIYQHIDYYTKKNGLR